MPTPTHDASLTFQGLNDDDTERGIRLPYPRQRELSHRRQRCQNGGKVLCSPYTRQRKRLVATSAPKGSGTLRFLNPFESLPSLSIRCTIRPPQGWESKNAATRERASGNDTGQCPISWDCRNAATRKRAALVRRIPYPSRRLTGCSMARIVHEGSLMRPRCQSFRLCPRPACVVRMKKPPRTNTNQSAEG